MIQTLVNLDYILALLIFKLNINNNFNLKKTQYQFFAKATATLFENYLSQINKIKQIPVKTNSDNNGKIFWSLLYDK